MVWIYVKPEVSFSKAYVEKFNYLKARQNKRMWKDKLDGRDK